MDDYLFEEEYLEEALQSAEPRLFNGSITCVCRADGRVPIVPDDELKLKDTSNPHVKNVYVKMDNESWQRVGPMNVFGFSLRNAEEIRVTCLRPHIYEPLLKVELVPSAIQSQKTISHYFSNLSTI